MTMVVHCFAEQAPVSAMMNAKGTAMMEDGLSKMGKVTPNLTTLDHKLVVLLQK